MTLALDPVSIRPVQRSLHLWPVLAGGLIIAAGDMIFALTLWFQWNAAGVEKLFQTIAVGVLGKASYDGGVQAAFLGACLHVAMATTFVFAYTVASWRIPRLLQRPLIHGPAYGMLFYIVMNFVVMPLSRVGKSPSFVHWDWIALSIAAHLIFGVICVLSAQRALSDTGTPAARRE